MLRVVTSHHEAHLSRTDPTTKKSRRSQETGSDRANRFAHNRRQTNLRTRERIAMTTVTLAGIVTANRSRRITRRRHQRRDTQTAISVWHPSAIVVTELCERRCAASGRRVIRRGASL